MEQNERKQSFSAIRVQAPVVPELKFYDRGSSSYCTYGADNLYPQYLYGLYTEVSTLKTVINGISEYTAGDSVQFTGFRFGENEVNRKGLKASELVRLLAKDYMTYGGFCFEVIRDSFGKPAEINYLDFKYVRSDKSGNVFWYSEDFKKGYVRSSKMVRIERYSELTKETNSIVYWKGETEEPYPLPLHSGSLKACEMERAIDTFHLNSIKNGFSGSFVFNFNNGLPDDKQKEEIEDMIERKFSGEENAGRFLINFSDGKDNQLNVSTLDITDFSEKYKAAAERSKKKIYEAFRAQPLLFGDTDIATGFSTQEFSDSFKVFNRTVILPIQNLIRDEIEKISGQGTLSITPFNIQF